MHLSEFLNFSRFLTCRGADPCLAMGGILCNSTPILPYFQHWGDEPRPRFSSRQQIKCRPKKRSSPKFQEVFSPNSSDTHADHSQNIGMDADVDLSQIIGGDAVKLLRGIYSTISPGLGTPAY